MFGPIERNAITQYGRVYVYAEPPGPFVPKGTADETTAPNNDLTYIGGTNGVTNGGTNGGEPPAAREPNLSNKFDGSSTWKVAGWGTLKTLLAKEVVGTLMLLGI